MLILDMTLHGPKDEEAEWTRDGHTAGAIELPTHLDHRGDVIHF